MVTRNMVSQTKPSRQSIQDRQLQGIKSHLLEILCLQNDFSPEDFRIELHIDTPANRDRYVINIAPRDKSNMAAWMAIAEVIGMIKGVYMGMKTRPQKSEKPIAGSMLMHPPIGGLLAADTTDQLAAAINQLTKHLTFALGHLKPREGHIRTLRDLPPIETNYPAL